MSHAAAEWVDVRTLIPWDANPYDHPDEQVADIAESIRANGWGDVIVAHGPSRRIVSGHGRRLAALRLLDADPSWRLPDAPEPAAVPVRWIDAPWDEVCEALAIAANETPRYAHRSESRLAEVLARLEKRRESGRRVGRHGVRAPDLRSLLAAREAAKVKPEPDAPADDSGDDGEPDSRIGEVYELGPHRLLCGDSTDPGAVARLFADTPRAALIHADPPYGMGKEADGVLNDNLYNDKLDAFQSAWWAVWRGFLADNGSAFVWGAAEDLWRWWYRQDGPAASERMSMRNEIVWDKGNGQGMGSADLRSFAPATERCLFFMLGAQAPPQTKEDYWPGWDGVRLWLAAERDRAGLTNSDVNRITGTNMAGHWFGESQWAMITREHYHALRKATGGEFFARPYDDDEAGRAEWQSVRAEWQSVRAEWLAGRAFFDNTHDHMTDVWRFPRVQGEERHGHATPKPVAMIERAIRSACPEGGIVGEPFGGSGSTLIAVAQSGRVCRIAELSPRYCDVIRRRWTRWARDNGQDPGPGALD